MKTMSDDILSVATPFPDVASLAQGYINRVDGERLLLPLELPCDEGAGVRFVIYLGDGTAAFAGAGRCVQVSDQGTNVPPTARYETLVDSLELDDRSRPVYEYIVAVRAAAYGQGEGEYADAGAEAHEDVADAGVEVEALVDAHADVDADVEAAPVEVDVASEHPVAQLEPVEEEPEAFSYEAAEPSEEAVSYEEAPSELSHEDAQAADAYASLAPEADSLEVPARPPSVRPGSIPTAALDSFRPEMASFVPPPLPTGILQRPARALHWQPAPPRRPTPLPQTGLFRYSGPGLPKPAAAPRPDLDPSLFVQRASRPG
jgi:hypothetical protein